MDMTTIQTSLGKVQGLEEEKLSAYLGIPFAEPPVKELSFRHPLPAKSWEGVLDATKGKANPIQSPFSGGATFIDQDCLYLNVFVPKGLEAKAPVIVWFYGGSYSHGGSGATNKDGNRLHYDMRLVALETRCIVVTFNYRVGLYGFLNLSQFGDKFDENNGFYDQLMALRFVRDNIAAFGGDPNNITLMGQSAGAACILAMMANKEARLLFKKAIVMSPCVEHFFTPEESQKQTKRFLRLARCKTEEDLFALTPKQILNASDSLEARNIIHRELRCAFSPTIDGKFLEGKPWKLCLDAGIPLFIGQTKEEALSFVQAIPAPLLSFAAKHMRIPKAKIKGAKNRYKVGMGLTNLIYAIPIGTMVRKYNGPVFTYRFDRPSPCGKKGTPHAFHISDVPYLIGENWFAKEGSDPDSVLLGQKIRAEFGSFARDGHPLSKQDPILFV